MFAGRICVFLFVILLNYGGGNCEVFTSIDQLTTLVESINGVAKALEQFLNDEYERIERARQIIVDFRNVSTLASANPEKFVGNPVNSFLLIKKLSKDLQEIVDGTNNFHQIKEMVNLIKNNYMLPTTEDYNGAAIALHRLEDTYNLKPSDIRTGKLSTNYPSRELTLFECYELGRIAYEQRDYYHTINWMTEALNLIDKGETSTKVDRFTVLDYLSYSTAQQGNVAHALNLSKEMLAIDPYHTRVKTNVEYYERLMNEELSSGDSADALTFKNKRPVSPYPERERYEALCRGEIPEISPKRLKKLKCRYINNHPLLVIAPVKEEQVFDQPALWLYHDVITNEQVETMKSLGAPKLKRAIVRSPITGEYVTADYRISKSGWLTDEEHPQLSYLTELVNAVTGLSLETAEEWQIANYGIGGQYEPHFDFARKSDPENAFAQSVGNRIATWLFYLEVPERGGATVFPSVGASIQPIRRSAAFWYNLLKSGDGDFDTRHAACPVLIGQKWVSNKWIHVVGQEFIRPCALKREISQEM